MSTELVVVPEEEVRKVREEVAPILAAAKALVVTDEATYQAALELGQECARRERHVEKVFKPAREAAHKAWKTITELLASFTDPLKEAKETCATKAKVWRREEEARRQREQAAAQALAQKKADEELLRHSVRLEEAGQPALAEEVLLAPVAPVVVPAAPIAAPVGTSYRENWQMEVTNFAALVKAVAAGELDLDVLQPNSKVLLARAKALKGAMKYPGVRVWDEGSVVFRSKPGA